MRLSLNKEEVAEFLKDLIIKFELVSAREMIEEKYFNVQYGDCCPMCAVYSPNGSSVNCEYCVYSYLATEDPCFTVKRRFEPDEWGNKYRKRRKKDYQLMWEMLLSFEG